VTDWQQVVASDFAVPQGVSVDRLVNELVEMLASPDPLVRDELGFSTLVTWIERGQVPSASLRPLGDEMAGRLADERIQARTFAPLVLAVIVATRDVCEARWLDAFEQWYVHERDVRGYDAHLGWLHAVAHGADLLGVLGRRPGVEPRRMLDLALRRMLAPAEAVWHDQEHERLALAVGQVLTREDLSEVDATSWLDPAIATVRPRGSGPVPPAVSNTVHTLRALALLVDRGVPVEPGQVVAVPHRETVREQVAQVLGSAVPWLR
jgi:hypothetical protein